MLQGMSSHLHKFKLRAISCTECPRFVNEFITYMGDMIMINDHIIICPIIICKVINWRSGIPKFKNTQLYKKHSSHWDLNRWNGGFYYFRVQCLHWCLYDQYNWCFVRTLFSWNVLGLCCNKVKRLKSALFIISS